MMNHRWQAEVDRLLQSATATAARVRARGYEELDAESMIAEATLAQALMQYDQTYESDAEAPAEA